MYINVIVLEDSVYIGRYSDDSSDLLKQLNIEDTEKNRKTKFVKCLFKIADCDIFDSINQISMATIKVEQNETPPWFNGDDALKRAKEAFKKWHDKHALINQEIKELSTGFYYLKNCKVECLSGNVEVENCVNCQIDIMLDKAGIRRCKDSQINKMVDESFVGRYVYTNNSGNCAYQNSKIESWGVEPRYVSKKNRLSDINEKYFETLKSIMESGDSIALEEANAKFDFFSLTKNQHKQLNEKTLDFFVGVAKKEIKQENLKPWKYLFDNTIYKARRCKKDNENIELEYFELLKSAIVNKDSSTLKDVFAFYDYFKLNPQQYIELLEVFLSVVAVNSINEDSLIWCTIHWELRRSIRIGKSEHRIKLCEKIKIISFVVMLLGLLGALLTFP